MNFERLEAPIALSIGTIQSMLIDYILPDILEKDTVIHQI